jgi:hypothetical protein
MVRDYNPAYVYYAKKMSDTSVTTASIRSVWREVASIGGQNRYYCLNFLWTLREILDWALGGPGLNRGRRHPTEVRVGDTIDSWRVIGVKPEKRLTLFMGMKAPGSGVLEFEIEPVEQRYTRVKATGYWQPRGMWGLLYWYSLVPVHLWIYKRLTQAITERAKAAEAEKQRKTTAAAQQVSNPNYP